MGKAFSMLLYLLLFLEKKKKKIGARIFLHALNLSCNISLAILWGMWLERNSRIFRDLERSREEVCEVVRFRASLWHLLAGLLVKL